MTKPMTDERLDRLRHIAAAQHGTMREFWREEGAALIAEVDRLRTALANVNEVHVCIAPGARPMCDHDGEAWPCTTVRAAGTDGRFTWDEG